MYRLIIRHGLLLAADGHRKENDNRAFWAPVSVGAEPTGPTHGDRRTTGHIFLSNFFEVTLQLLWER